MADKPDVRDDEDPGQALNNSPMPRAARDTIAAIATASGHGGIGVVRVSGPDLSVLAQALVGCVPTPRMATRSVFRDREGRVLDQGLAIYFPSPSSYTGEDVLELQGHGGPVVMHLLLARCTELGARLARPGEFTERAFLNDKLDLAQAEAVADLIDASTEAAARCAVRSLAGEFSERVRSFQSQLTDLRVLVEATLDFPEEELGDAYSYDIRRRLDSLRSSLSAVLKQGRTGSLLRSGLTAALIGRPNVGKSSLLNRLSGEDVAIVTPVPGTTRDSVRQVIQVDGLPIHVVDTAGLRSTSDPVELLGIERTWAAVERADLVLLITDEKEELGTEDSAILARLPERSCRIFVLNKIDLSGTRAHVEYVAAQTRVYLSALTGEGVELLRDALREAAGWHPGTEDVFLARERHLQAFEGAGNHLERASLQFERVELLAEDLRDAQRALGVITGEFAADDLLGEIFSRFCIGK